MFRSFFYFLKVKYLGVVCADPCDYMKRYGESLKRVEDMPGNLKKHITYCNRKYFINFCCQIWQRIFRFKKVIFWRLMLPMQALN